MRLSPTDDITCALWLVALIEAFGHFGPLGIFVWLFGILLIGTIAHVVKLTSATPVAKSWNSKPLGKHSKTATQAKKSNSTNRRIT